MLAVELARPTEKVMAGLLASATDKRLEVPLDM